MYALVLRMAGTPPMSQETGHVASDYSPIDMMCEVKFINEFFIEECWVCLEKAATFAPCCYCLGNLVRESFTKCK